MSPRSRSRLVSDSDDAAQDEQDTPADPDVPLDDAAEALRAQDEAQTFELPDRAGASAPEMLPGLGFEGSSARQQRVTDPAPQRRGADLQTLEDLWTAYPKIGRGDWKWRIERLHPKTYGGVQVAGVLGDFLERMSMQEFRQKFGGNLYEITVMQPVGEGGPDGAAGYRRVKTIKIRLPGSPTMAGIEEDQDMPGRYGQGGYPPQVMGEHPNVRVRELELDHERSKMEYERQRELESQLREQMEHASRTPEGTIETLSRAQQSALEEVKRTNESALMMWQQQAEELRAELKARDSEMNQLRRDLAEAQVQAANTARHIETDAMRQQKDSFDSEMRRIRDDHAERVARLQEDHRKEVADITARHTDERRNYESQQQIERERVRDDAKTRIDAAQDMAKREVEGLRRDYDARLEDMKRQQERELLSVKERFESEIRAIRESEKSQAAFAKESADIKVTLAGDQAQRYEAEASALRQEVEELRSQLHKPAMEALMEAKEMASAFGMVEPSEVKAEAEQQTMGQQLFGLAKGVVDNIPGIIEKVTDSRGRAQQMREHEMHQIARLQQHQMQHGPRRPMPGQHRLALPPGVQGSGRGVPGVGSLPPPAMGPQMGNVPLHSGAMDSLTQPGDVPIQGGLPFNVPSPIQPPGQPQTGVVAPGPALGNAGMPLGAEAPPQSVGYMAPPMVPPPAPPVQTAPEVPPPPPTPTPVEQEPGPQGEPGPSAAAQGVAILGTLPAEAVQEFFVSLEQAVQTRMVTPLDFAQTFVQRVGHEKTAELVREMNPSDVIDVVRQAGGEASALATRDGYRYVEELWAHVQMILTEAASAESVAETGPVEASDAPVQVTMPNEQTVVAAQSFEPAQDVPLEAEGPPEPETPPQAADAGA
jgi:hypothetical protein